MAYLGPKGKDIFMSDTGKPYKFGFIKVKVSGSNLKSVVEALAHYHAVRGKSANDEMKALCAIVSSCRKWLRVKQPKVAGLAAAGPETTVLKRHRAVNSLMDESLNTLRGMLAVGGGFADAIVAYENRKDGGQRAVRGPLAAGYVNERMAFLRFNKKKAISGTQVAELLETNKTRTGLTLSAKANATFDRAYRQPAITHDDRAEQNHGPKFFTTLTLKDWEKIDEIAKEVQGHQIEVRYLSKFQRLNCMLESDGNGGLQYCSGLAATTQHMNGDPFAMDHWGNAFCMPDDNGIYGMFNHSSFTSGDEVVCAGNMKIGNDGKIIRLDNVSGHYAPNLERLRAFVEILVNEYHVNFANTEIWAMTKQGGHPVNYVWGPVADGRLILVSRSVNDFLNRQPDSRNQAWVV